MDPRRSSTPWGIPPPPRRCGRGRGGRGGGGGGVGLDLGLGRPPDLGGSRRISTIGAASADSNLTEIRDPSRSLAEIRGEIRDRRLQAASPPPAGSAARDGHGSGGAGPAVAALGTRTSSCTRLPPSVVTACSASPPRRKQRGQAPTLRVPRAATAGHGQRAPAGTRTAPPPQGGPHRAEPPWSTARGPGRQVRRAAGGAGRSRPDGRIAGGTGVEAGTRRGTRRGNVRVQVDASRGDEGSSTEVWRG